MSTYAIEIECSNCGRVGKLQIAKGEPVPEAIECPRCGCKTAKQVKE